MGTLTPFCYFSGLGLTDHLNAAFDELAQCFTFQHTVCQQGKVDQLADQFISTSIFGQDAVALFYQFVNLFVRIRHIFLLFRSDFFFFLLALQEMFKSQLPKIEKTDFIVTFEALGENSNPVMLTQSEYMRRMREMSAMQPGMSFYGEMPDNYNLVLNTDHELVKKVLSEEEQNCEEKLKPILADLKGWKARQSDLREAQNSKKEEEITSAEKEDMTNTNHKIDELTAQRNAILAEYAGNNKLVSQLIDLALLANGMLKGEALSQFIKRSVQMIG